MLVGLAILLYLAIDAADGLLVRYLHDFKSLELYVVSRPLLFQLVGLRHAFYASYPLLNIEKKIVLKGRLPSLVALMGL